MKILFLYLFALVSLTCKGQDIINTKKGESIKAKVLEITTEEVKYKKFEFQDGPSYSLKKADLLGVTYQNGQEDLFKMESKGDKRMFIWSPSMKKVELPKITTESELVVFIEDERATPPRKSIVEFSSAELKDLIANTLKSQGGNIKIVDSKATAKSSNSGLVISIGAYNATFYPGAWHTQTRYFVEVIKNGQKHQKEIESLKGAFNTFGASTAKSRLSKSFEDATTQMIDFVNQHL